MGGRGVSMNVCGGQGGGSPAFGAHDNNKRPSKRPSNRFNHDVPDRARWVPEIRRTVPAASIAGSTEPNRRAFSSANILISRPRKKQRFLYFFSIGIPFFRQGAPLKASSPFSYNTFSNENGARIGPPPPLKTGAAPYRLIRPGPVHTILRAAWSVVVENSKNYEKKLWLTGSPSRPQPGCGPQHEA